MVSGSDCESPMNKDKLDSRTLPDKVLNVTQTDAASPFPFSDLGSR